MVNWFTILIVFLNVWWLVFFMALPFGATPPEEIGKGHSAGAPARTYLGVKALATTVIAMLITVAFFYFTSGYLILPE